MIGMQTYHEKYHRPGSGRATAVLHLQWIRTHPLFIPESKIPDGYNTYFEFMQMVYNNTTDQSCDMLANIYFADDLRFSESYETRLAAAKTEYRIGDKLFHHFITIGFNHQTWSVAKCKAVIETIISFSWVLKCRAVFEYHRENGTHPHVHFVITTDISKSKVIEKIWRTGGMQKIVLKKSFIECKPALPVHYNYVMLIKQESKHQYIAKDIIWRKANNIPEFYEK